jgi:hypothetical protein
MPVKLAHLDMDRIIAALNAEVNIGFVKGD